MTLEEAKGLKVGMILYSTVYMNADGTAQKWKVNGKVKVWRRHPERVNVPIKRGLYTYDYLTHLDLEYLSLTEKKEEQNTNNAPEVIEGVRDGNI